MTGFIYTPTMRDIEQLERRIEDLEKKVFNLENHGHSYAASYGPGGEWDTTTGPIPAKQIT